jgi:putative hydrolase of the HAD superfamily
VLRAIVFDFDGVIIDTEWSAFTIWQHVFAEHGAELTLEDFVVSIGTRGAIDFERLLTEKTGRPAPNNRELRAWKQPLQDAAVADLPLMPGVGRWLDDARAAGRTIAIASSSERHWIVPHLDRHDIADRFSHLSTWDGPHVGFPPKPAPDLYQRSLAALGVQPNEALAIEDSHNGAIAAKAAGMHVLAVPTRLTRQLDFAIADLVVDSLADLSLHQAEAQLLVAPRVRTTDYAHPAAAALALAQQSELARRWDEEPPCGPGGDADEFDEPDGVFLVTEIDGRAIGCGGLRRHDATTGEIKRVYIDPAHRGRGLSRKLMAHLELAARTIGYRRLVLETGIRLPEAIGLYESSGWQRIRNYGEYQDSPDSRCYEKSLR